MKYKIINNENFLVGIVAALSIVLILAVIFPNLRISNSGRVSAEVITVNGCEDCFDLDNVLKIVENDNTIEIKETKNLEYNSKEGKSIIEKYRIKTIPAMIVKSKGIEKKEFDKEIFSSGRNYLIFSKSVPYLDLASGEIKGMVDFKEIQDSLCIECASLSSLEEQLEALGIKKKNYEIIDSSTDEGKELIKKNNIQFYNNLLIGKEIEEYWWIFPALNNALIEEEDYYVFSEPLVYPYKEVVSGGIKGKVEAIYITANDCKDCYNISILKDKFKKSGIYISKEKYIDYSSGEGQQLSLNYNISAVPTIIFSKEISDYQTLSENLKELGTFEKDDSFVFRELKNLNLKYKEI